MGGALEVAFERVEAEGHMCNHIFLASARFGARCIWVGFLPDSARDPTQMSRIIEANRTVARRDQSNEWRLELHLT